MAEKEKINNDKITISPFFATPLMEVHLDLDLEKLTDFTLQIHNKDKKGSPHSPGSNREGWQSKDVTKENHEEFIRLKEKINYYLQLYHSEVFCGMTNITQKITNMWISIYKKHDYREWHIHGMSTLSGAYYIKHDSSTESGNILFKHPNNHYMRLAHWPEGTLEMPNEITSEIIDVVPKSNMLLIFPAWTEHKVEPNLKNDSRISLSFNALPILEKKS
jgi:uncharacterized protein (TIGR02466 family)